MMSSALAVANVYRAAYQVTDVVGDFEFAIRPRALGMDHTLWDTLAIKVSEKIDQVEVLQKERPILPHTL